MAEAYQLAYEGDTVSAFGGIVGFNSTLSEATAQAMQAALKEVRALLQLMRAMDRRLGEQLVTPLGPWFAGVHREMPPPVLHALVMESRASIDGFEATLSELSQATERAWRAAQAIPPDEGR